MPRPRLATTKKHLTTSKVWRTRLVFWLGASMIGLIATAMVVAGDWIEIHFQKAFALWPLLPLLLTPLGFLSITYLTRTYVPRAEGSGLPQTIAALGMKNHKQRSQVLSIKIGLSKAGLILLGLCSGASIGRGGPTIHIAACIAYSLSRFARFPHYELCRGLILAGAAAGLTAAFNTPLAGIMFTIEEMTRRYEERLNTTIIMGVILTSITFMLLLGNYRYIGSVQSHNFESSIFLAVLVCGILGGLVGGAFSFVLVRVGRLLTPSREAKPYHFAVFCGLAVAIIGITSGGLTFGTGYFEIQHFVHGEYDMSFEYSIMKILATVISYWSGIPGGIFSPTLSIGAGLGAEVSQWFPELSASFLIMLGMAAYFTGVVQTPITAAILIVEMTGNIHLLMPLIAVTLIANSVSKYFNNEPIYRALAAEFLRGFKASPENSKAS